MKESLNKIPDELFVHLRPQGRPVMDRVRLALNLNKN